MGPTHQSFFHFPLPLPSLPTDASRSVTDASRSVSRSFPLHYGRIHAAGQGSAAHSPVSVGQGSAMRSPGRRQGRAHPHGGGAEVTRGLCSSSNLATPVASFFLNSGKPLSSSFSLVSCACSTHPTEDDSIRSFFLGAKQARISWEYSHMGCPRPWRPPNQTGWSRGRSIPP
jgi:hypothetical protein